MPSRLAKRRWRASGTLRLWEAASTPVSSRTTLTARGHRDWRTDEHLRPSLVHDRRPQRVSGRGRLLPLRRAQLVLLDRAGRARWTSTVKARTSGRYLSGSQAVTFNLRCDDLRPGGRPQRHDGSHAVDLRRPACESAAWLVELGKKTSIYVALCADSTHASGHCVSDAGVAALSRVLQPAPALGAQEDRRRALQHVQRHRLLRGHRHRRRRPDRPVAARAGQAEQERGRSMRISEIVEKTGLEALNALGRRRHHGGVRLRHGVGHHHRRPERQPAGHPADAQEPHRGGQRGRRRHGGVRPRQAPGARMWSSLADRVGIALFTTPDRHLDVRRQALRARHEVGGSVTATARSRRPAGARRAGRARRSLGEHHARVRGRPLGSRAGAAARAGGARVPARRTPCGASRAGCRISESEVFGVATFYAQFRFTPPGRHQLRVCLGTACHVKGGVQMLDTLERRLGVERRRDDGRRRVRPGARRLPGLLRPGARGHARRRPSTAR